MKRKRQRRNRKIWSIAFKIDTNTQYSSLTIFDAVTFIQEQSLNMNTFITSVRNANNVCTTTDNTGYNKKNINIHYHGLELPIFVCTLDTKNMESITCIRRCTVLPFKSRTCFRYFSNCLPHKWTKNIGFFKFLECILYLTI